MVDLLIGASAGPAPPAPALTGPSAAVPLAQPGMHDRDPLLTHYGLRERVKTAEAAALAAQAAQAKAEEQLRATLQ